MNANGKAILVIGGGISGMTAALEIAELGHHVILVEKEPFLGGRVIRMHRYFPKMCPPACGFEINTRRLRSNPRISVHTMATVESLTGRVGQFTARILTRPRYVTGRLSLDDSAIEELRTERPDDVNMGMSTTKALYMPHDMAYPHLHVLDRAALSAEDAATLARLAPPGAIDLNMTEEDIEVEVAAVIVATGWRPYDPTNLEHLGYGRCRNVVTNMMMERLATTGGPTKGAILRPSDGQPPHSVAFVQCAGSRDEKHLPYCSAVCCMASLKQARYLRELCPDARITIFYIDIRAVGRHEKFYFEMLADDHVSFVKGKVAKVSEEPGTGNLVLDVEDTLAGHRLHEAFDLVVLASGVVPSSADARLPVSLKYDAYGFIDGTTDVPGIYATGCAKRPCDVSRAAKDSVAAALKAVQCLSQGE
jgi:quinone-modifying oxidoreductase subunit QmoA